MNAAILIMDKRLCRAPADRDYGPLRLVLGHGSLFSRQNEHCRCQGRAGARDGIESRSKPNFILHRDGFVTRKVGGAPGPQLIVEAVGEPHLGGVTAVENFQGIDADVGTDVKASFDADANASGTVGGGIGGGKDAK
jgi:hypothetical protein